VSSGSEAAAARERERLLRAVERVSWLAFVAALVAQTAAVFVVVGVLHYPISTQRDSWEYVNITDNILAGHGFSAEPVAPWRPNASRTPGFLVTDVPVRLAFSGSDLLAGIAGRAWPATAALLLVATARRLGAGAWAPAAGALLLIMPTVVYYSIVVYETEASYLMAACLMAFGAVKLLVDGSRRGLSWLAVGSGWAVALRPAALVMTLGVAASCLIAALFFRRTLEGRRLAAAGLAVALSVGAVWIAWSLRNVAVFGTFSYSTIPSYNTLIYNAKAMAPYVDATSRAEILAAVKREYYYIQTYYEPDQFERAGRQRREGLRFMRTHPWAFFVSHANGSLRSFAVFEVMEIRRKLGTPLITGLSIAQGLLTLLGAVGLWRVARSQGPGVPLALGFICAMGVLSTATGGAVDSPRFRILLEISVSLGVVFLLQGTTAASVADGKGSRANPDLSEDGVPRRARFARGTQAGFLGLSRGSVAPCECDTGKEFR
jgi:hypothetical protein